MKRIALLLLLSVLPASAQDIAGASAPYSACMSRAQSTVDMVTCMNAEMKVQDGFLNTQYRSALATLPADQQSKLRKAQRDWLTFRKSDCDVFYGRETGTIASIEAGHCMLQHTVRRVEDLKQFSNKP